MAKSAPNTTPKHASKVAATPPAAATPNAATSATTVPPTGPKSPAARAKRAVVPATAAASAKATGKPAERARETKIAVKPASRAVARSSRHPNLGLAPLNMRAGFPEAAEKLRRETARFAALALENAVEKDPTIEIRYDEVGLRHLLRDGELLVERLALCLGSDNPRWLVEYAEWIAPIYRRRGVSLLDMCALAEGVRQAAPAGLGSDERASAERALDAATAIWKRNSRLAGDRHRRNALWKWMYRGV